MMRTTLASLLLMALAAACGAPTGSGAASPTGTATATGTTAAASPSPTGTGAGASSVKDVCTLVTKAEAEAVVGTVTEQPMETSAPLTGVAEKAAVCLYRGASGALTVAVLERAMTRSDFDAVARQIPGVQPVSGIGDSAYAGSIGASGAGGASVLVLKGSTYFTITTTSGAKSGDALLDAIKDLARKAATSL